MKLEYIAGIVIVIVVVLYILYKNNQENLENDNTKVQKEQLENNNSPILGVYYTEWCGYSQQFLRALQNDIIPALEQNKLDKAFQIKLVDCDKHKEECAKNNVPGFPTLILHKDNSNIPYDGDRSPDDLIHFLKQHL